MSQILPEKPAASVIALTCRGGDFFGNISRNSKRVADFVMRIPLGSCGGQRGNSCSFPSLFATGLSRGTKQR